MKPFNFGGVLRCCASAMKKAPTNPQKGDRVQCDHCPDGFRFDGEEWVGIHAPDGYRGLQVWMLDDDSA